MPVTTQHLQQLGQKLSALSNHLQKTPLVKLDTGSAEDKNAALKAAVLGLQTTGDSPQAFITEEEYELLSIPAFSNTNEVESAAATSIVTGAIVRTLEKVNSFIPSTQRRGDFMKLEMKDLMQINSTDTAAKLDYLMVNSSTDNLSQLGENIPEMCKTLENIKEGAYSLHPIVLLGVFVQCKDTTLEERKKAFTAALVNDNCLGGILCADVKTDNGNARHTKFVAEAGKLFDAFEKLAERDADGKIQKTLSLDVTTFEKVKAFIGALFKCGLIIPAVCEYMGIGDKYLKSVRATKLEAQKEADSFVKLISDTDASNQITSNDAKHCMAVAA